MASFSQLDVWSERMWAPWSRDPACFKLLESPEPRIVPGTQNLLDSFTHSFVHSILNTGLGLGLGWRCSEISALYSEVEVGPYDKSRKAGREPGIAVWGSAGHGRKFRLVPLTFTPLLNFWDPWEPRAPNSLSSPRAAFAADSTQHSHRTIFLGEVSLDLYQSHLQTDAWPKFLLLSTPEFSSWKLVGELKSSLEVLLKQSKACQGSV